MRTLTLSLTLTLLAGLGCGDATAPEPAGSWGGPEATLVLAPTGGTVTFLCGSGTIDAGWRVAQDGRWTASGQYFGGGGPLPVGGGTPYDAQYAGTVSGNILTFTVLVPDLALRLGPYRVVRDAPGASEICV